MWITNKLDISKTFLIDIFCSFPRIDGGTHLDRKFVMSSVKRFFGRIRIHCNNSLSIDVDHDHLDVGPEKIKDFTIIIRVSSTYGVRCILGASYIVIHNNEYFQCYRLK